MTRQQDVNEGPSLTNCGALRKISEGDPVNSLVTPSIAADDVDIGQELFFSITGGTGADVFKVSSCSGAITIVDAITAASPKQYTLDITVTDDHASALTDSCSITINVDNRAPSLTPATFVTPENRLVDDVVGVVTVRVRMWLECVPCCLSSSLPPCAPGRLLAILCQAGNRSGRRSADVHPAAGRRRECLLHRSWDWQTQGQDSGVELRSQAIVSAQEGAGSVGPVSPCIPRFLNQVHCTGASV